MQISTGWSFNPSSLAHPRRPGKKKMRWTHNCQSWKSLALSKIQLFHPRNPQHKTFHPRIRYMQRILPHPNILHLSMVLPLFCRIWLCYVQFKTPLINCNPVQTWAYHNASKNTKSHLFRINLPDCISMCQDFVRDFSYWMEYLR